MGPRKRGATPLAEQLAAADVVLIPVNDNQNAEQADGGGHWSLLVFHRGGDAARRFDHYDSCNHANLPHARSIMAVLCKLLCLQGHRKAPADKDEHSSQANGYDCGVYCLAIAEMVCAATAEHQASSSSDIHELITAAITQLTPTVVHAKRSEWYELLLGALSSA